MARGRRHASTLADRVAQWPTHNKARMTHAVYAEADTLALADHVLTLNNALRDAVNQARYVQAIHARLKAAV